MSQLLIDDGVDWIRLSCLTVIGVLLKGTPVISYSSGVQGSVSFSEGGVGCFLVFEAHSDTCPCIHVVEVRCIICQGFVSDLLY